MNNKIEVLHIQQDSQIALTYIDSLKAFEEIKRLVDCRYLEYHLIAIDHTLFGIWMDDSGLLENKVITAFSNRYGYLRGNLVITHAEGVEDDGYQDLTEDDVKTLVHALAVGRLKANEDTLVVLNDDLYI